MRLTGPEIIDRVEKGLITITPFDPKRMGPNSYDVCLAPTLYEVRPPKMWGHPEPLDLKKEYNYIEKRIPESGFTLKPGHFYLGVTKEFVGSDHVIPFIDGRSSLARYNLVIHQTAGFGDLGFAGHITLEMTVTLPLVIYPNIRIAQVSFEAVQGQIQLYKGKYSNEFSSDPKPKVGVPGNF